MNNSSNLPKLTLDQFKTRYHLIRGAGNVEVQVQRVSGDMPSLSRTNEGGTARIVNLNVVFGHNIDAIVEEFKKAHGETGKAEIEYSVLNGKTATYNVESNSGEDVPANGETVTAVISEYTPTTDASMNKGETILVVSGLRLKKAQTVTESMDDLFSFADEAEEDNTDENAVEETADDKVLDDVI